MKNKFLTFLLFSILCGYEVNQTVTKAASHFFAEPQTQKDLEDENRKFSSPKPTPGNSQNGKPSPSKLPSPRNSNLSPQTNSESNPSPTKTPFDRRDFDEGGAGGVGLNPSKKNSVDGESNVLLSLPNWIFPSLAAVLFLSGATALFWYLFRRVERRRIELANALNRMQQKHEKLNMDFEKYKSEAIALANQVGEQKLEITALKRSPPPIVKSESNYENNPQDNYAYPAPKSNFNQPIQPDPIFPVSVDNYLKNVGRGVGVKYDYKTDLLLENADAESSLVVVRDDTIPGGLHYVIPRFGIFQTGNDFIHVKHYYTCQHPTGGTIWIKEPAVVQRVEGGWQMTLQGELEVK